MIMKRLIGRPDPMAQRLAGGVQTVFDVRASAALLCAAVPNTAEPGDRTVSTMSFDDFGALAADASGEYGDGLRWTLTADGTLTITGRGAMPDYTQEELVMTEHAWEKPPVPWLEYDADLRAVVIGEGITHIGDYTFYDAQQVTSVTLPSTLRSIGKYVFTNCAAEAIALATPTSPWQPTSAPEIEAFCLTILPIRPLPKNSGLK